MSNKTWLIDFDGVVNAVSRKGDTNVWKDWKQTKLMGWDDHGYPVNYSQTVVDLIAYAVSQGVNVVWLSTWAEETKQFPQAIPGMPELPFIGSQRDIHNVSYPDKTHWKLDAAREYVDPGHDLLWTEDEAYLTEVIASEWRLLRPGKTTVINPYTPIGLSQRQVEQIMTWIG